MKNTIFFSLVFLFVFKLSAQDSSKIVVFLNPYFTNDYIDNEFKITNKNSQYPNSVSGRFEDPIKTTFYNANIDVKVYLPIRNNYIAIIQAGIGKSNYLSTIGYSQFLYRDINGNNIFENRELIENINGKSINFQYGIGKKYLLDKNKKLSLVIEGLLYASANSAYKEINDYKVGESKNSNSGMNYLYSNFHGGVKCNLALNYQLYKHFGVGLTVNDLLNTYLLSNYSNENYAIDENEFIFKIGQLSKPVLSIIVFF